MWWAIIIAVLVIAGIVLASRDGRTRAQGKAGRGYTDDLIDGGCTLPQPRPSPSYGPDQNTPGHAYEDNRFF